MVAGPLAAYLISGSTAATQCGVVFGGVLLCFSTVFAIMRGNERRFHLVAIHACAWATLLYDPSTNLVVTGDVVAEVIGCVTGFLACSLMQAWRSSIHACCLTTFWTIECALVMLNTELGGWGFGWYTRWIS